MISVQEAIARLRRFLRERDLEDRWNVVLRLSSAATRGVKALLEVANEPGLLFLKGGDLVPITEVADDIVRLLSAPGDVSAFGAADVIQIFLDEIDSFSRVKGVSSADVAKLHPVTKHEKEIKAAIHSIIGDPYIEKDWGGEQSDIFSGHVLVRGVRTTAAFALKGPSVKGVLTVKAMGQNGDQGVRLTETPATLYVVQHVNSISVNVQRLLLAMARQAAQRDGAMKYVCIMDGVDTARLLKAYDYLS